jgi:hypothetical protein
MPLNGARSVRSFGAAVRSPTVGGFVSTVDSWLVLGLGLAHAVSLVTVSYCHYFISPPSRLGWFGLELAFAAFSWWPASVFVRYALRPAVRRLQSIDRNRFFAVSAALGGVTAAWWSDALNDDLWLHSRWVADVLRFVLFFARAGVFAAGYATLLALTVRACQPAGESDPGASPRTAGSIWPTLTVLGFLVPANAFAVWYLGCERVVYGWDYMTYWIKAADMGRHARSGPAAEVWDEFRRGVRTDDYGPLAAVVPAAAAAIFGGSRLVFILAVVNIYLAAVALTAARFVRRFAPATEGLAQVIPAAAVLLSPLAWAPVLRGYLDVGGVALGITVVLVYLRRPAGALRWTDVVVLGGLLAGLALFRRWYCYYVTAFAFLATVDTTWTAVRIGMRDGWRSAVRVVGPFALIGTWASLFVGTFASTWVRRVLTTDYSNDYAAYHSPAPLVDRVSIVLDNCGPAHAAAVLVAFAALALRVDTRRIALLVGGMLPIMLLQMLKTADPGIHHLYLFLPAYVLLPSLAVVRWLGPSPAVIRWPVVGMLFAWGLAEMAVMFVPAAHPLFDPLRPAVSRLDSTPLKRPDLPEFVRLLRGADAAAAGAGRGKVYVAASSHVINPTMFTTADRSLDEPVFAPDRLLPSPEIDRVSCFPVGLFEADVVVVAWPPQTHLDPAEHQVVVLAAERLHARVGIGRAFDPLPEVYELADGVVARIYLRSRPIDPNDVAEFSTALKSAHPNQPGLFTPPPGFEKCLRTP